jgi:hypothetical protein
MYLKTNVKVIFAVIIAFIAEVAKLKTLLTT